MTAAAVAAAGAVFRQAPSYGDRGGGGGCGGGGRRSYAGSGGGGGGGGSRYGGYSD